MLRIENHACIWYNNRNYSAIRRSVMQNELTGALTGLANLFVDALLFPFGDPGGFAAGEITAHRECGVGQI